MINEERYKQLMNNVGLPNSRSLLQALQQCAMEATIEVREQLQASQEECAELRAKELGFIQSLTELSNNYLASQKENAALKVQVNELREELQFIKNEEDSYDTEQDTLGRIFLATENALNNTKEQSLAAHDNEVIENCACLCDSIAEDEQFGNLLATGANECADAIRNLKKEW